MTDFLSGAPAFGLVLSLSAYLLGDFARKRLKLLWLHPLLPAVLLVIAVLLLTGLPYESYIESAGLLSFLLGPATVCLAIPLYKRLRLLRRNWKAVLGGALAGVLSSLFGVLLLAKLTGLGAAEYASLLPKSVTTAIGVGIAAELGGQRAVSGALIILTGIFGSLSAGLVCRLFGLREPLAKGLAIGTSAHAIGTAKAFEMGETEGAVSGLAIVISGVLTVIFAPLFAGLIG
ncbi:MAG: LrgB family protein [Christensenellaceae bacterium]|jgi:predicted murein hydrolase (TIGR00659 family)|nr:LrgB family protein [Christensenellaceae bacterium]